MFGVTGTHEGGGGATYNAGVPKTGQTTSYRTGDDGDLEKGVAWPDPRFTDHGNGTVTDNLTGLMWTKNANLPGGSTWNDAIDYCNAMNAGAGTYGYNDWRLPNVRELQSLIDYSRWSPALPSGHPFTGVQPYSYWSSSSADLSYEAWFVYLPLGRVDHDNNADEYYVWPVRAGQ